MCELRSAFSTNYKLFIRRPDRFDKSVDSYELFYRTESESNFKSVTIEAETKEEHHKVSLKQCDQIWLLLSYNFLSVCDNWIAIFDTYKSFYISRFLHCSCNIFKNGWVAWHFWPQKKLIVLISERNNLVTPASLIKSNFRCQAMIKNISIKWGYFYLRHLSKQLVARP